MVSRCKNYVLKIIVITLYTWIISKGNGEKIVCDDLQLGQYFCPEPDIDYATQAAVGCTENHTVQVKCDAAAVDNDGRNITECFQNVSCRYTACYKSCNRIGSYYSSPDFAINAHSHGNTCTINGHSYKTALSLSVFLGMFGIDRFYLGYPAIGLLKFCTLGFFFIFQLVDVILIATQVVGPADGSAYVIDYYGPRLTHISGNMDTYYKPRE